MEKYIIDKDITVFYVEARSFPEGIGDACKKLFSLLPGGSKRTQYGISYPDKSGRIIYKAAVEESFPGEGAQLGCKTFLIKKGVYASEWLVNWKNEESVIGETFQKLLKHPDVDPKGYCLEIYQNENNVHCLVPLI